MRANVRGPQATAARVGGLILSEVGFAASLSAALLLFLLRSRLPSYTDGLGLLALFFFILIGVVLAASIGVVHHAEELAEQFGEPYGTLILTLSAISIEVIMVLAMMMHATPDETLARDTVYSTLMILINGLIGLAMLLGGLKHGEQQYNLKSSTTFFSMILAIAGLGLFLPSHLPPASLPSYQWFLIFLAIPLYATFLRVQTKEHRSFFSFPGHRPVTNHAGGRRSAWFHVILLCGTLVTIVYLAESLAVVIDDGVQLLGLPTQLASLIIALLVLAPEGLAAVRAGLRNEMQRVVNIALGSALSTISLTIPTMLTVGMLTRRSVVLGLTPVQSLMLALTLLIGMNSYKHGETNALQGAIHFMLFAAFIALIFIL